MANAATIAGLAFSNAFLGINHALAHAVGARFGIAHGRANAIFLPHVLRYNASLPTKFMPAPGYSAYVAPEKYAQIAWVIGLGGKAEESAASASSTGSTSYCDERRHAGIAGGGRSGRGGVPGRASRARRQRLR